MIYAFYEVLRDRIYGDHWRVEAERLSGTQGGCAMSDMKPCPCCGGRWWGERTPEHCPCPQEDIREDGKCAVHTEID